MEKPINSLFEAVMSMKNRTRIALITITGSIFSGIIQGIQNEGGTDIYIVTLRLEKGNLDICCKLI